MLKRIAVLAVMIVLVLTLPLPASAQTWFQIRYWPTTNSWYYSGGAPPDVTSNSTFWGLSVRRSVGVWGLSFNIDSGQDNFPGGGSPQTETIWNLNLHRNFSLPNGMASIYAGYGSASYNATTPNWVWSQQGFRIGADFRMNLQNNLYVVGDLGYGPFGNVTLTNIFVGGTTTEPASVLDWRLGAGIKRGPWEFEAGYRSFNWRVTPSATTCATTPCGTAWAGWYLGVNFTTP
jgi:hypothetical protein